MELEKAIKVSDYEYEIYTFDKIYDKFKGLIIAESKRYNTVMNIEDSFQTASVGLLKAFRSYDITKDIKFITVATTYIKNELRLQYRQIKLISKLFYDFTSSKDCEQAIEKKLMVEDIQDRIIEKEAARQRANEVYKVIDEEFTERQKQIFELYIIRDYPLLKVAEIVQCNTSYVTKVTKTCKEKIYSKLGRTA